MNRSDSQNQAGLGLASPPVMALARRKGWELVVVFGSAARGEAPRDVDVAVLTPSQPTLLEQGGWQAELETLWAPRPVDRWTIWISSTLTTSP